MECKKCGIDLTGKEYKNVAQWPFCLECFEALMNKAEEKKVEPAAPVAEAAAEQQRCMICENDIEKGTGHEMLGFIFCQDCYENLVRRPNIPPRAEAGDQPSADGYPEKQPVAQVRVDLKSPIQCYSCGRQIPAAGSKQFNDHAYCPDCYYNLPEVKAQKPKPFPTAVSGQSQNTKDPYAGAEEHDGLLRCQACRRPVLPADLKTVEGFEICLACLMTDRDTALEIARRRHRKALDKIKNDLDI